MKTKLKSILMVALCAVGLAAFAAEPDCVQLWKDGPYFATCNVGTSEVAEHPEYGALYKFDEAGTAVKSLLGEEWRVPTQEELQKLDGEIPGFCTKTWDDTKKGYTFTGVGDYSTKSIFLPAAGYNSGRTSCGTTGKYWTSTEADNYNGKYFNAGSSVFVNSWDKGGLLSVRAVRDAPASVPYLDWDDVEKKMTNAVCKVFEVVTNETATFEAGKTYVVLGNVEQPVHGITVEGTEATPARLILCDGTKLTVRGQSSAETAALNVGDGKAIVICGQKLGTGELVATGGSAGVGGNASQTGGTVTINGGTVTATGGSYAAGIGGGNGGAGGTVTINGGTVTANGGESAAGIGGGGGRSGGTVTINGGTVTATGGYPAAGIGVGAFGVSGGTVTFGGQGFSVVTGKTATVTAPIAQDDYAADHSAVYAFIKAPLPGTKDNPWKIGATADDTVDAYIDENGKLVIEGNGAMKAFNAAKSPAPWGNTISEVEIGEDVTSIGAYAFNGCSALTDVTLKATRPPAVGNGAFAGCSITAVNVPLWSKGAYLHTAGWDGFNIKEPEVPQIWADGHRVAANDQVGVCSWTWHSDMATALAEMQADGRYNGMQLALAPWLGIDSMSLYFGGKESSEMWDFIKEKIASGELNVMATMINFPKEDYTSLTTITNTMGYMYGVADGASDADEQWATNLFLTAEAARLSKELGVDTLTTEAGFICIDENLMFERMKEVCMTCAVHGVQILIESGPQTSLFLTNLLVNLEKEGYTNVGINFDPGDTQLFFSYEALNHETPTDSYAIMKPWIRMVHVKDCKLDRPAWNEDCVWGDGIVSQMDFNDWAKVGGQVERPFLEQLAAEGYMGNILYERLSGDATLTPERKAEITLAMDRIFGALPAPIAAESDEFTVDLRTSVELAEGEVTIPNVAWSATLWGAVGETFTTVSYENLTTGETGVFGNLSNIMGEGAMDAVLPLKDGEYQLSHSTGDLTSFVTFVVSGYPLGCETNPWKVGPAGDPEATVAWTDGDDTVYFQPPRSDVSREGLETITNALGGTGFDTALVSADGTATNDVRMIIGASGKQYMTLEDMFASDDDSFKLFDVTGCVVTYDGMGAAGSMATETFLPGVETNLAANAFMAVGYEFQGWSTNGGIRVVFRDRAAIDDPQPGDIYELTAVWKSAPLKVTTFEQLKDALAAATQQGAELSASINISGTITVPYGEKVELPGDPSKAEVVLMGSGAIKGYVKRGGNLVISTNVKVLPWTVGNGVTARLDENGTLHIEGKGKMNDFTDANPAPWAGVASDIKAIEVAEGVTKIGNAAFVGLDFMDTTSTLSIVNEVHELNLLAFVSEDGSVTNAPWMSQFRVVRDGTVESVAAFGPKGSTAFYGSVEEALTCGDTTSMLLLTLAETVQREKDYLTATAGDKPYSKQMQGFLDEAFAKLDDAEGYGDVVDVHQDYADQIEELAEKNKTNEIPGTDITWRVLDGTLVIEGKGEMPGFVEPDYPDGAPWNEMQTDITNVTVAAGITSVGDAAFAVCPANGEASVLFKNPALELNLGAFTSGDGSATNVPTVKVEIVTDDGRTLRVVPGGWTDADNSFVTYDSLAEAIEDGATTVKAAFEKKTDAGDVVVPPAEVEEVVKTVTDESGDEIELTAKYVNIPADDGSTDGLVSEIENLPTVVDIVNSNVLVEVTAVETAVVPTAVAEEMDEAMIAACEAVKIDRGVESVPTIGFRSCYLDVSAFWSFKDGGGQLTELPKSIIAHIPMKLYDGQIYSVSRRHEGVTEVLPPWYEGIDDGDTAEWVKVDVANQELLVKACKFCDYAIGELQLEKSCSVIVGSDGKYVGDRDPVSLPTNFTLTVTGPIDLADFAGYAKRAVGESAGEYAVNFVCVRMPEDFPAAGFDVQLGVFTIEDRPDRIDPTGKVTYAKATKGNLLFPSKPATWKAKPGLCCKFAGWVWIGEGAEPAGFRKLSENERRNQKLRFTVGKNEKIAPKDFAATWVRIDEDLLTEVHWAATNRLATDSRSYVTMSVKGVPSGLKFVAKKLSFSGKAKKNGRFKVTVSAKNASGYSLKQTGYLVVAGKKVVGYEPLDPKLTGVPLMLWCDTKLGSVKGAGVFKAKSTRTVSATPKKGYVFAGWFADPGFSTPAKFKGGKDYRTAKQQIVVKGPTYLFARFLPKTTTADPITWLRYAGAGYCGAPASFLDEQETWYQGVKLPTNACQIAFTSASLPTVTVTGLPKGVTFDKKTLRFKGVPTKSGKFTVKVTVKNKSAATDVLTRKVVVKALPKWLVGTYDGVSFGPDGEAGLVENGIATVTVGSTGKISGKTVVKGKKSSFKASSFANVVLDGEALVYVSGTKTFAESEETGLGEFVWTTNGVERAWAVQRGWSRKDLALPLPVFPTGTKALKLTETADDGSVIKLSFGSKGAVTVAGKVPGKGGKLVAISGSSRVIPTGVGTVQDAPEAPERLSELFAETCVNIAPTKTVPAGFCAAEPLVFTVNSSNKATAVANPAD